MDRSRDEIFNGDGSPPVPKQTLELTAAGAMNCQQLLQEAREDLDLIGQNSLLDEPALIRFARERGVKVTGVVEGDPSRFLDLGWLPADESDAPRSPRFHPFRIYTLQIIASACDLRITPSSTINRDRFPTFAREVMDLLPSLDEVSNLACEANEIIDLAILLEPLYWPRIVSQITKSTFVRSADFEARRMRHRHRVQEFMTQLDLSNWERRHEKLRLVAAAMDENDDVYLLLRVAPWSKRQRVTGRLGGALWVRHIAEVLRLAFEECRGARWVEEDQAYGTWLGGGRALVYGSDRPTENLDTTRGRVAFEFGVYTGSTTRWYLEGETEYHAIRRLLPRGATGTVELVNLRGEIASGRGNAALRLADLLGQDMEARRFSIVSFDVDVQANVRAIRSQIEQDRIVGVVSAHDPDFEFANFSLPELIEIAARMDEHDGFDPIPVRTGEWTGVLNARSFEDRYRMLSKRGRSLKGAKWGEALAEFVAQNQQRSDNRLPRRFVQTVYQALRTRVVRYDQHRAQFRINPSTFRLVAR